MQSPLTISITTTTTTTTCVIIILLVLVIMTSSLFNQSLAANIKHKKDDNEYPGASSSSSLVLGLTHSRKISFPHDPAVLSKLSSRSSSEYSTATTMKPLIEMLDDMLEPLREVRDGYLISLKIGTPPQVIQVYMDTGSDLTWVPCGTLSFDCIDCDDYKKYFKYLMSSTFSPSYSSSSMRDLCTSSFCTGIHNSDNYYDPCTIAGCSLVTLLKGTCPRPCPSFSYTYGAGGVVVGTLTRDSLRIHGSDPSVTRDISSFCFGCVGSTYREPIGIAGFGKGSLSFPSQLGFLSKGFSHCFLSFKYANNPNISSQLVIGDLAISSKDHLQFTPMLKSLMYPNYYYIGLEAISVGNNYNMSSSAVVLEVPSNLRVFDSQGNGGMLIDSGTTYTHLPEPFYSKFLSMLDSVITYPRSTEHERRTGFDLCYKIPCLNNSISNDHVDDINLPSVSFHFLNNVTLALPKENYFYAMGAPSTATVIKCLLFQSMEDGEYGPAAVFGSFQQQNIKVVYDLNKEKIGFQPMDCASSAPSISASTTN